MTSHDWSGFSRRSLIHQEGSSLLLLPPLNSSTEAAISFAVPRTLQGSAARGEFDFELLKGIMEQSHKESRAVLQREITALLRSQPQTQVTVSSQASAIWN